MVRIKLDELKKEIEKYINVPYFINIPPLKLEKPEPVLVGKGSAKEIALKTIELANQNNINLVNLDSQQIYNFQKKNHLGIDCSGLASQLLNFILKKDILPITKTSANSLTSKPLSNSVPLSQIKTGDLIRQDNGHHVLFVVEKINDHVIYVDSSQKNRGVQYGQFDITAPEIKIDGVYRLKQLI